MKRLPASTGSCFFAVNFLTTMQPLKANLLFTATLLCCIGLNGCKENTATAHAAAKDSTILQKDYSTIYTKIAEAKSILKDGDLVTRSDNDFESATLQNFSHTDKSFSHSGIVFKEDSIFYVYHAMAGAENPSGKCRKDPFDSFVNPLKKTGLGIFRYELTSTEMDKFHRIIQENEKKQIPFDLMFNISNDDSLYCSEMIYKALKKSTGNRIILPTSMLYNFKPKIFGFKYRQLLLKKFEYVSIDNLYLNSHCKEIKRISY